MYPSILLHIPQALLRQWVLPLAPSAEDGDAGISPNPLLDGLFTRRALVRTCMPQSSCLLSSRHC